jgi:hypothetical protein
MMFSLFVDIVATCRWLTRGPVRTFSNCQHLAQRRHIQHRFRQQLLKIAKPFYVDERKTNKGIRLTDELRQLVIEQNGVDQFPEVEARWRLVETAWELGVSSNVIAVHHEAETDNLIINKSNRRKTITSSRDALNGYHFIQMNREGRSWGCLRGIILPAYCWLLY